MKLLLILALLTAPTNFTYGYMHTDTPLYLDAECAQLITTLPATYFCIVLQSDREVYKVSYKDITGYVKDIDVVDYEPVTKYASASFTVNNDGYPAKLRSAPSEHSQVIVELPHGQSGYYYGDAAGSTLIEQVGDKWRYVSYNDGAKTHHGYVYSSQVTATSIPPNVIEKVEQYTANQQNSPAKNPDFLLIICLCAPSLLITFLLFSGKERKSRYKE